MTMHRHSHRGRDHNHSNAFYTTQPTQPIARLQPTTQHESPTTASSLSFPSSLSPTVTNAATLRWFSPQSGEHILHLMYDDTINMHIITVLSRGRSISFTLSRGQARDFSKVLQRFAAQPTKTRTGVPLWLRIVQKLNLFTR